MTKRLFFVFAILLGSALVLATTTRLGKVLDESGRPIAGAVVSDGHNRVFSAEDGTFYFFTAADSILIQRLGYLPRRVAFRDIAKPIVLKAEPVILPKVTVTESAWDLLASPPDRISLPIDPDRHYYSAGEIISSTPSASTGGVRLAGESQGISILGNLSRHTLVLLDGIPLNPDGESYDLSLLETGEIESIELIKNNASVYGGSSAIGGIVSITTKKGAHQRGEKFALSTEAGSFGYAKNTFTFETARETWKLRLHLANLDTDNDFPYRMPDWWNADSTAIRENNAKRQNSISASFSTRINKARILLRSDLSTFRRGLPGTVNFLEVYRNAFLEGSAGRNQITVDSKFLGCEASALLWLNLDRTLYDNTRAPLAVYLSKYRQTMRDLGLRGSLGKELPLGSRILFTAGFAGEAGTRHYVNSDLLGAQTDLDHYSRFANASLKGGLKLDLGDMIWDSSAAGRYDYGDREDNFSWRLESSLRRFGRIETTLGATLGTSFSLPSPYDLYWRGDSQALGNPDLESESSRGWQFWLQNRLEPFSLKAAFHHNEIKNLIQWRQVQMFGNVWKPVNIGKASIQNLELEAGFQPLEWLRLTGSALLTKALDVSTLPPDEAPRLMYTPDMNYTLRMDIDHSRFGFWASYGFTGEQYFTPDNLVDPLPSYSLLDLGISFPISYQDWILTPHISVRNLLNEAYSVYAYVPQPGISFHGGVTLRSPE